MSLIWNNFKKDVRQNRLVIGLWLAALAIPAVLGVLVPATTGKPALWNIYQLVAMLAPALRFILMLVLIPLVIQQDPLVDSRAFWLTRPISRRMLLASKALFLGLVILLPVILGEVVVLAGSGLGLRHVLLAVPEVLLEVTASALLISVLAAFTSNLVRFAVTGICYLVGYGIASVVVGLILSHVFSGRVKELSIASTGMLHAQTLVGWGASLLIGGSVLAWQYLVHRKRSAIILAVIGALGIIVVRNVHPCLQAKHISGKPAVSVAPGLAEVSLSLNRITSNENPLGWKKTQTFTAAFAFHNQPRGSILEVTGGDLALTTAGGRVCKGRIFAADMKELSPGITAATCPLGGALPEAMEHELGNVHVLNPGSNTAMVVTTFDTTLTMINADDNAACMGQKLSVTGEIEIVASACQLAAKAPLKSDASLSFGLDADRILSVGTNNPAMFASVEHAMNPERGVRAANEKTTYVTIRKRIANLAFDPSKDDDNFGERAQPWRDVTYLLFNRKAGNEVAKCEAVDPDDLNFLMMSGLWMASPPRLEYCDVVLSFPELSEEWLKDAELVCFRKTKPETISCHVSADELVVESAVAK